MAEIKRIGPWPFARLYALSMAIFGFFIGLLFGVIALLGGVAAESLGWGAGLGALSIIVFPIMYGLLGLLAGFLGAFVYNLLAKWVGGIEIDLSK